MRLVFWQNLLSPHQAPFIRELPNLGCTVTLLASEEMSADRRALGWETPDLRGVRVLLSPSSARISREVAAAGPEAIHIFAGARWTSLGNDALRACLAQPHPPRLIVMSESPDPRGLGGFARQAKYTLERLRYGRHYRCILGIGLPARRWFRACGYPGRRIFPFAYVADPPRATTVPPAHAGTIAPRSTSILFIGRLAPGKGLDVLLRAFASADLAGAKLGIVGDGPASACLRSLADRLGIADRLNWFGARPANEVRAILAGASLTVLPSRHDGWGVVINESLMAGTPVLCTRACGAAELVSADPAGRRGSLLGSVIPPDNVESLTEALRFWAGRFPISQPHRRHIQTWAACLQGPAIARYFCQVLRHLFVACSPRPEAPWLSRPRPYARL